MHLEGKAAVVTGAGRGIGRAVALQLAKDGAAVIVVDPGSDRSGAGNDPEPAEGVVKEIKAAGGKAAANFGSVADFNACGQMIEQCKKEFGKIDILVNVAGMLRERMVWNMSEDDWKAVIDVHLNGHFNTSHHAAKEMRAQQGGRIVNFSSDAWRGTVGQCNYAAAKAGIIGLTRAMARELGRFGVTINAICPLAGTRMTLNDAVIAGLKKRLENGIITQDYFDRAMAMPGPEYVAPIVSYLASDHADYINGQVIHAERGKTSTYAAPIETHALLKSTDDGMFTYDDFCEGMPNMMTAFPNPAPRQD